jgi:hypothetical protein
MSRDHKTLDVKEYSMQKSLTVSKHMKPARYRRALGAGVLADNKVKISQIDLGQEAPGSFQLAINKR